MLILARLSFATRLYKPAGVRLDGRKDAGPDAIYRPRPFRSAEYNLLQNRLKADESRRKSGQERQNWLNEAATYPENVKQKIKNAIVEALSHKQNGNDAPIPVKLQWKSNAGPPDVQVTYDPGVPSYTIDISNCVPPMALRRERKKQY
jgi:hypothetical protein